MTRAMCGWAFAVAGVLGVAGMVGHAQSPAVLVLMDRTAVDYGEPPHRIPADAANEAIASVGLREPIPYFGARVGETVSLPLGSDTDAGWFALSSAPTTWASGDGPGGGSGDGLENFFLAAAGLGSPDADDNRTSLLTSVQGVSALRVGDVNLLLGRRVCAVVYSGEVVIGAESTSLAGATLGIVALEVHGVDLSDQTSPTVSATVLDVRSTCRLIAGL